MRHSITTNNSFLPLPTAILNVSLVNLSTLTPIHIWQRSLSQALRHLTSWPVIRSLRNWRSFPSLSGDGSEEDGEKKEKKEMIVDHDFEGNRKGRIMIFWWFPLIRIVELVKFEIGDSNQNLRALHFEPVEST